MTKKPESAGSDQYPPTKVQREAMLVAQGHRCAVCQRSFHEKTKKGTCIRSFCDHNHKTGRIRGMLCLVCNRRVIGRRRDPRIFEQAAIYLRRKKALGL